jgi:hypothetical protein
VDFGILGFGAIYSPLQNSRIEVQMRGSPWKGTEGVEKEYPIIVKVTIMALM